MFKIPITFGEAKETSFPWQLSEKFPLFDVFLFFKQEFIEKIISIKVMQVAETTQNQKSNTLSQYDEQLDLCKQIFVNKSKDYGTSWRIMRPKSVTDQLFIKAQRIRTLEETGISKVGDDVDGEFQALVNYGLMALIQLTHKPTVEDDLSADEAEELYEEQAHEVRRIMIAKDHDYGAAWRDMRISSFTDLILTKILRIKQIENNAGKTIVSEGLEGHYTDIVNYSLFALIRLNED